jgi:hypothetical protein
MSSNFVSMMLSSLAECLNNSDTPDFFELKWDEGHIRIGKEQDSAIQMLEQAIESLENPPTRSKSIQRGKNESKKPTDREALLLQEFSGKTLSAKETAAFFNKCGMPLDTTVCSTYLGCMVKHGFAQRVNRGIYKIGGSDDVAETLR